MVVMARLSPKFVGLLVSVLALSFSPSLAQLPTAPPLPVQFSEKELLQFVLNLEYLETEFFLVSAYGYGLDGINSTLAGGGPAPVGGRQASLSPQVRAMAEVMGLQEVDHVTAIREFLGPDANPRPLIDLGNSWSQFFKFATGNSSVNFSPYTDDLSWLIAAYALPYVGLTGYVGTNPLLQSVDAKKLVAGLLAVESGQDAMIRLKLWLNSDYLVPPYGQPVYALTENVSRARNCLDGSLTIDDEGILVPPQLGAHANTTNNILSANAWSLAYARNPEQILRVVYGSGASNITGGFFPNGATGNIAKYFLTNNTAPPPTPPGESPPRELYCPPLPQQPPPTPCTNPPPSPPTLPCTSPPPSPSGGPP